MRNLGAPAAEGYGMTAISAARSRPLDLTAAIPTPPRPDVAPTGPDYDALFQASARAPDVSRMPRTHAGASGVQALVPAAGASSSLEKLDALEAQLAGPYRIPGQPGRLSAPPTFHSNYARKEQLQAQPQLHDLAQRALHGPQALAEATRFDGCTSQLEASHLFHVRKGGLDAAAQARTGDVIHLAPSASTESRQHNVVVRANVGKVVAVPGPGGHTRGSVYAARGGDR